jgi:hypothetical protein
MLDLRIFVSSPGDVGREREIAQRIIARLQGEFTAQARLTPYFWEHEPMLANAGDYQENIPAPGDFDIFLCLLWSRLGTRLGSKHRTQDGKTFESGTVYEFENALEAARGSASPEHPHGRPDMLIFVKSPDGKDGKHCPVLRPTMKWAAGKTLNRRLRRRRPGRRSSAPSRRSNICRRRVEPRRVSRLIDRRDQFPVGMTAGAGDDSGLTGAVASFRTSWPSNSRR